MCFLSQFSGHLWKSCTNATEQGKGEEHHKSDLWEDTTKHRVKTPQRLSQPLGHCRWMSDRCGGSSMALLFQQQSRLENCQPRLPSAPHYRLIPHFFRLFLAWIISVNYFTAWHHKPSCWHWRAVKRTRGKGPKNPPFSNLLHNKYQNSL